MTTPVSTTCPACGFHVAVPIYDGGREPLATLGWPASAGEARAMPRLPLDFVSCVDCGHVFNAAFDYREVPYSGKPNLMFNRGARWAAFLEKIRRETLRRLPAKPVVVEIGHGDGGFLRALANACAGGRCIGFDPHGRAGNGDPRVQFRQVLFDPWPHLPELKPDLLISRHVLEHLSDPLAFIQRLSFAACWFEMRPLLYLEVPCVDRALATGRISDLYYEHNSHFTTESFSRMLRRSFTAIEALDHGYGGEVVYAFLRLRGDHEHLERARMAEAFRELAAGSRGSLALQLAVLHLSGKRVAVWGGTGKCAAFLQAAGADAGRFPLVVDSDPAKAGTFVPGTGQEILFRDVLIEHPAEIIIIPTEWRARDIVLEIRRCGIRFEQILVVRGGRLIDYFQDPHP